MSHSPIGIFDSGIGGLTVANAVSALLPHESIVYFGDTAHLPYGDKSPQAIRSYSKTIMHFLLDQGCKMIVIACNSASASVGKSYQKWLPPQYPVVNVIDPVIQFVGEKKPNKIGLIGTKRTIKSGVFPKHMKEQNPQKKIQALATPLLAPMIEEGFYNNNISKTIIKAYLDNPRLLGIESLVLACTHYPLIENEVKQLLSKDITVINSAAVVADSVQKVLTEKMLLNTSEEAAHHQFYISDFTPEFEQAARRFFGEKIKLSERNLWNPFA